MALLFFDTVICYNGKKVWEEDMQKKAISRIIVAVGLAIVMCAAIAVGCFMLIKENKLNNIQETAINELEANIGRYDESRIVLKNTSHSAASALAEKYGAKLRITDDGSFATLILPDETTIRDIFADRDNREDIPYMSADYMVSTFEEGEEEEVASRPVATAPDYEVSDGLYKFQSYLDYINVGETWNRNRGAGITVAIVDTGIDTNHPEFAGKISEYSYNATEDKIVKDYDLSVIEDEYGHGTAVAGTIAASMDGNGTVGVAPEVSLLVIKAECNSNGTFYRSSDLVFGIYYAIERDVDIINMSFGGYGGNPYADATKLAADSDIVCVAAAGNDSTSVLMYPAADENVIGVGALADGSFELASYSNYGDNSDMVAPGTVYTAQVGGGYGTINGTSFASPIVAGALALLKAQSGYMEVADVRELLYASSADIGSLGEDWFFGYGALDVNALVCEERGTITFDMLTDEVDDIEQVFIRNHTLQNLPEPERNYAVFDGWYYDIHCEEELNWYADIFTSDITLYANWVNEDDGIPYTYVILDDGTVEIRSYTGHRRYITIPDRIEGRVVSSIGDFAFENQSRLVQVNLPEGLTNIGMAAFSGCTQLVEIAVPDGVETIGSNAFANCARLSAVELSGDIALTTIGDMAFANCGSLTVFDIPENVSYLNGSAFFGANGMRAFSVAPGNTHFMTEGGVLFNITGETLVAYPAGLSGEYSIPDRVTAIGGHSFGYAKLASIDLGNVSTIGEYAFAYSLLESLSIPDSVTSFGQYAFAYNYYLKDLEIGSGVYSITKYSFAYDYELSSLYIPANIIQIEEWAFAYSGVQNIGFATDGQLMQIGDYAFFLNDVRALNVPATLISVGGASFMNNYNLASLTFEGQSNLQYIGGNAFAYAYALTSVGLPESLLEIGDYAFSYTSLSGTVTIHENVRHIGFGVFAECHDLTYIEVDDDNADYVDVDGTAYTSDLTTAVMYPVGNDAVEYVIPEGTLVINEAAFYGAHNLTNIVLPQSLTNIEAYAFYDVPNITAIDIPDNVIQISNYAFANDYALEYINFTPTSKLPRISYAAFAYTGINSFRVPASVSTMAQYAFEGCKNLTSITFAEGSRLESISAYMFIGCDNLSEIIFEEGSALTSIQAHGLEGMTNLRTIDFGDAKLTNIDNFAFRYDENLQSITIPEGVEYIGRYAFYMNKSLNEITLPASLQFIGRNAFYGTNDISLYFASELLPATLQENWDSGIGGYYLGVKEVITEGDWQYAVAESGNVSIISYGGDQSVLDLTSLDLSYGGDIVSIGGYAFYDSGITSITLPETLVNIQRYAFAYSSLEQIFVPANVTFIGGYAFYNTPVESVTFGENSVLSTIEQYAFAYTSSLGQIALPQSLDELGSYAFFNSAISSVSFGQNSSLSTIPAHAFGATDLVTVTLPDSVTYIDDNAFRDCRSLASVTFGGGENLQLHSNVFYNTGLSSVTIPANMEYIGEYAFVGLENLENFVVSEENEFYSAIDGVLYNKDGTKLIAMPAGREGSFTVPASVETIGFGAFENSSLSEVLFEDGINLLTLGYRAFYNAENLKTISVPASVVSIDYYAFAECDSLYQVNFAPDNKLTGIYEGAFLNCSNLTDITVPDSIIEISDYAFYGCRGLEELPVSDTSALKGIYDYAFAYSGLTSLDLPASIIDIGEYAFMGTNLTSVTIPEENKLVLNIGLGAFADCNRITQMTLPFVGVGYEDSDISWFGYIFGAGSYEANSVYVPASLEEVTITDGITFIGENAFYGLADLKRINVPHSVTALYIGAFEGTTALYELTNTIILYNNNDGIDTPSHGFFGYGLAGTLHLAEGITNVTPWAMDGMLYLEELILPDSLEFIDYCAFYNCYDLVSVTLGTNLKEIGGAAFVGCRRLTEIYNNSSIQLEFGSTDHGQIANSASLMVSADGTKTYRDGEFIYIDTPDNFRFMQEGNKYTLIDYNGNADIVELPVSINGSAYDIYLEKNYHIKTVVIPEGITEISAHAFANCANLVEVHLPESLLTIEDYAFQNCTNLRKVNIPSQITSIPGWCFNGTAIEEIVIPEGVTYIGDSAFDGCKNLTNIVIPDSVTYIRYSAFANCTGVKSVYIGKNLTNFASTTFSGCIQLESLTFSPENENYVSVDSMIYNKDMTEILFAPRTLSGHITLPDTLKTIGGRVFAECNLITGITIPDSVTEIGYSAFCNCTSLEEVDLPEGITNIPWGLFENCVNLRRVYIPSGVTGIDSYAFSNCSKLVDFEFPESLEGMGYGAFQGCTGIETLVFPENFTHIDVYAFNNCYGLREVILPEGMTELSRDIFDQCYNLQKITIPSTMEFIDPSVFDGCEKLYEVINNSNLPITFDNTEYGGLTSNCQVIINADGTKMTRYDDVITIDTPEGFRFVRQNGEYSLNDYLGESTDITLPENIEGSSYSINLRGVPNIRSVVVPDGFTVIDDFAFFGCVNLESVTLPSTIKVIGGSAFSECVSLRTVDIRSGVEEVRSDAFSNSTSLEEAVLPDTVTTIGSRVFQNTAFSNNADNWKDGALYSGVNLISVAKDLERFIVPDTTACIAEDAFEDCFLLTQVTIGGEHRGALYNVTNLRTLILTDVPSSIYNYFEFYGSHVPVTLKDIVIKLGATVEGSGTFSGIYGVTIYVEEAENNIMWDHDYTGWNNNNAVYYDGEWIKADFIDFEGNVIFESYYTVEQVIRQPYVGDVIRGEEKYVFVGWDTDGDGVADTLPATSAYNITARAVMVNSAVTYSVVFLGLNGEVMYSYNAEYGAQITPPENVEIKGYEFLGWIGYVPGMIVTGDVEFLSQWQHLGGGHEYVLTTVAPTCTEQGYDSYVCSVCGDEYEYRENYTEPLGHSFGEWTVTIASDCRNEGVRTRKCGVCGAVEEETVSASGHEYVVVGGHEPSCEQPGDKIYQCSVCGDTVTEQVPPAGHNYEKKVVSKSWIKMLIELLANIFFGYEGDDAYYFRCTECGKVMTGENMSAMGASSSGSHIHTPGEWEVYTPASCVDGLEVRYCLTCGEVAEGRTIAANGRHAYGEWQQVIAPDCVSAGSERRDCQYCDAFETREVAALGHDLIHHEAQAPTCTEIGWEAYDTCSRCDYTTYKEIPAKGHVSSAPIRENEVAATCTTNGKYDEVVYCSVCYEELSRETVTVPAIGHAWGEWTQTKAPTCTEAGKEQRVCANDPSHVETREVAALGHDLIHHEAQAPTCTEIGWEAYDTCSRCAYTTYEEIPATGHTASEWIVDKPAACEEAGSQHKECSVCHEVLETEEILATGHVSGEPVHENEVAATCTADGSYDEVIYCSVCHKELSRETVVVPAIGHAWGEWEQTKEPTYTEAGEETHSCSACGATETRPVAALGLVRKFQDEVAAVEAAQSRSERYEAICTALTTYGELSEEEKTAVADDYAVLDEAIAAYNASAEAVNGEMNAAMEVAVKVLSSAVAVVAVLAGAWFVLKRLF